MNRLICFFAGAIGLSGLVGIRTGLKAGMMSATVTLVMVVVVVLFKSSGDLIGTIAMLIMLAIRAAIGCSMAPIPLPHQWDWKSWAALLIWALDLVLIWAVITYLPGML